MSTLAPALVLALALSLCVPAVAAAPLAPADCGNDGVLVQAGLQNSNDCGGDCTNRGVWLVVGLANEDGCGACDNEGLYAQVGGGCGRQWPVACVQELCVCVDCPTTAATAAGGERNPLSGCSPVVHGQNVWVYCGETRVACGVVEDPSCWAVRLACFFAAGPVDGSTPPGWTVECPTQP